MKETLNVLRLLAFLLLSNVLYGLLLMIPMALIDSQGTFTGMMGYSVLVGGCIIFAVVGSALFGGLAVLIGRINPYPKLGMLLLLVMVAIIWIAGVFNTYDTIEESGRSFQGQVYANLSVMGIAMLYLSVRIYGLLDYARQAYR